MPGPVPKPVPKPDDPYLYKVLGVSRFASARDIKQAYAKLALQRHPDHGGTKEAFQELGEAYELLKNKRRRALYDAGQPDVASPIEL